MATREVPSVNIKGAADLILSQILHWRTHGSLRRMLPWAFHLMLHGSALLACASCIELQTRQCAGRIQVSWFDPAKSKIKKIRSSGMVPAQTSCGIRHRCLARSGAFERHSCRPVCADVYGILVVAYWLWHVSYGILVMAGLSRNTRSL